jgi:hypothetical protein
MVKKKVITIKVTSLTTTSQRGLLLMDGVKFHLDEVTNAIKIVNFDIEIFPSDSTGHWTSV